MLFEWGTTLHEKLQRVAVDSWLRIRVKGLTGDGVALEHLLVEGLFVKRLDNVTKAGAVSPVYKLGRHEKVVTATALDARIIHLTQKVLHVFAPILATHLTELSLKLRESFVWHNIANLVDDACDAFIHIGTRPEQPLSATHTDVGYVWHGGDFGLWRRKGRGRAAK